MVTFIEKGDIFALEDVYSYAHGCNCAGTMGKGIAVQFQDKFPEMYEQYHSLCQEEKFHSGDVFDYDYGKGHIYDLATQVSWRTYASLENIEVALVKMLELAAKENVKRIALPAIGAGLGGLRWEDVKALIVRVADSNPDIELCVVENYSNSVSSKQYMKIVLGVVMSKEFSDFHRNAVHEFEKILIDGLREFKSDWIECLSIRFIVHRLSSSSSLNRFVPSIMRIKQ